MKNVTKVMITVGLLTGSYAHAARGPSNVRLSVCEGASAVEHTKSCTNHQSRLDLYRAGFGMCYGMIYDGRFGQAAADTDVYNRKGEFRQNGESILAGGNKGFLRLEFTSDGEAMVTRQDQVEILNCD